MINLKIKTIYSIKNNYIYDNGMETGVRACYSKKGIRQLYSWSRETCRLRLKEIEHKIYRQNDDGTFRCSKKVFSPIGLCYILDYFGVP